MRAFLSRRAAAALALIWSASVDADPWLPPGDPALRHDVQLLTDLGVLTGPAITWPLSWGDLANAIGRADLESLDAGGRAALARLAQRVEEEKRAFVHVPSVRVSLDEEPRILRTFEATPRESQEVAAGLAWTGRRMSYRLQGALVSDPDDDENVRFDGSYVGAALGNWMLSANALDRWWGPGWDGSLILSSNARPIPALSLNRNLSDPSVRPWLRWAGPWSATMLMGQLESDRDVPDALFFGARFAFKPVKSLEIGLSRTAQWCGEGRPCHLSTFWDLLVGNDTRGVSTTLPEEPGNQLAGADLRWSGGPHGRRYAVYGQMIGDDIAGGAPSKFTGLYGVEHWGFIERLQSSYRVHVEGANTIVDFLGKDQFNTAYEHFIYTDGYRYRGHAIGHTLDNDGRMVSLGGLLLAPGSRTWSALVQVANINIDGTEKAPHSVSATHARLFDIEVGHSRPFARGILTLALGYEHFDHPSLDETDDSPRFYAQWQSQR